MRLTLGEIYRIGRWVLILPWICTMDEGCAAVEASRGGALQTSASARPSQSMWEILEP